jgi:outer membrane protein TolC
MKDLKDWKWLLKKYNLLSLFICTFFTTLVAQNNYLSKTKENILNYSYEKAIQDSKNLQNDWINPITYKYMYTNTETYNTTKSIISISQPIFKSGRIYYSIKYAKSVKSKTNRDIDIQKKELIKQTINLLFQIQQINITVKKQKLLVKNALLDVERKKEQVLNGILDTSFLDNSILDLNVNRNSLIDLEYQKTTFINNLSKLSDKKYNELELPVLTLLDHNNYMTKNIYIKKVQDDINVGYWLKNMTRSSYLPTINFTVDYTKYHDTNNYAELSKDSTKNYGFNITIPLDIKYSYDIESSKIEYLKIKASLHDKRREEKIIFENSLAKIESLNKKIIIAKNDINLYDSLTTQIQEQLNVGMKTKSDLETIQNSKKIKNLEIESINIDKQIELLEIYYRMEI